MPHSKAIRFATANTERMRIDSSGRLLINTTSALATEGFLQVACNSNTDGVQFHCTDTSSVNILEMKHANANGSDTGLMIAFRSTSGNMVGSIVSNGSSTSYNTSSDYRLKENVTAISDAITRLKTLKPSRFNFKVDKDTTVDGFLAHEVSSIIPEAITGTKDETEDILYTEKDTIPSGKKVGDVKETVPKYQGIDQSKLVPLLTAALQEAVAKIEVLETKVAALGG